MQLIERYAKSCDKNLVNINDLCYFKAEISKPNQCLTNFRFDTSSGLCVSTLSNDAATFFNPKNNSCPTNTIMINVNNNNKCAENKYVQPAKCSGNLMTLNATSCWNRMTRPTSLECGQGDKVVDEKCQSPPLCPTNPFTGDKLNYDELTKLCK